MSDRPSMSIDGRRVSIDDPPYVIAELSANHNGRLDTALKIIDAAAAAGAEALKLQTYRPDTITLDCDSEDFRIDSGPWKGNTLYELYQKAHMPWEWHGPLFDHARKLGTSIFSTPFDTTAVDLLEDLNAPAYKIASFEAIDLPLIKYVASTGKPMIISTGMADAEEIEEAVETARDGGCSEIAILHCVSGYPAPAADYNLRTIADMIARFGLVTGLSDHTLDNVTAIASVAVGASIIEKHLTLDRGGGGPDDSFSLEPPELAALCGSVRTAWQALGQVDYGRKSSEQGNVRFRRSLYFVKPLKAGDVVTSNAVRSIRPGFGASPKFLDQVIGRRLRNSVPACSPVQLEQLVSAPAFTAETDHAVQVPDDPDLLELMLSDTAAAPAEFQATARWKGYSEQIAGHLRTVGLKDFRRRTYEKGTPGAVFASFGALDNNPGQAKPEAMYHYAATCYLGEGARSIDELEASTVGNPEGFTVKNRFYTLSWLNHFCRYAYVSKFVRFGSQTIVEVGSGAGKQAEMLKKAHPDLTLVLFDLPTQLYVCNQYLSTVFAGTDAVIDYRRGREFRSFADVVPGKINIVPHWKFGIVEGAPIDLLWNAASFQEMESATANTYLGLARSAKAMYLMHIIKFRDDAPPAGSRGVIGSRVMSGFREVDRVIAQLARPRENWLYFDSFWENRHPARADRAKVNP